jgi:hypothetical protein
MIRNMVLGLAIFAGQGIATSQPQAAQAAQAQAQAPTATGASPALALALTGQRYPAPPGTPVPFPFPWMIALLPFVALFTFMAVQRQDSAGPATKTSQGDALGDNLDLQSQLIAACGGDSALAQRAIQAALASDPDLDINSTRAIQIALRIAPMLMSPAPSPDKA